MKYLNGIIDSINRVPPIDPDATAFFNRVTAAGGSLTATEQTAINTLVKSLKLNNIWASMSAIYPMVGSSAASCAQNLKSSSFTGAFSGGWVFSSTGALPNGTNGFMNTSLTPSSTLTQDSTHYTYYSRTNSISAQQDIGVVMTDPNRCSFEISYNGTLSSDQYNYVTGRMSTANANTLGFYIATRTNSTTHKVFKNSSQIGTTNTGVSGSLSLISNPVYIGRTNATIYYSTKECAFSSIGAGLSDTDCSNLYTTVQTFQTSLSRQV